MLEELRALVRDRTDWPVRSEFDECGQRALYDAMGRAGARSALAADLGIAVPANHVRISKYWTDPRIEAALRVLLRDRNSWPSRREFREAGLAGMAGAIEASGHRERWAARFGVAVSRRWFEPTIRITLETFMAGRDEWPTPEQFAEAGLSGLYRSIKRRKQLERWQLHFGVTA
jgi:hypothetical protein